MENNKLQIFSNQDFGEIRTVTGANGEPLFCLSDVCKTMGLRVNDTAKRLGDDPVTIGVIDKLGRTQKAYFINEDGLYDVILDSRKPEAKAFRKWLTSEVIPSIRKQGGYMVAKPNETPEETMARALLIAQATMEQQKKRIENLEGENAKQRELVNRQRPYVAYVNEVLLSSDCYTSTQIAKELDLPSANSLHKWLNSIGVMFLEGKQWLLYAKYAGNGYTQTRTFAYKTKDGNQHTRVSTVWTEAGRAFLVELAEPWRVVDNRDNFSHFNIPTNK